MAETLMTKVKNEARAFLYAPIFPFLQKDWPAKMWIFVALSYVPIVNVIIARGWRMEYVRRLGWQEEPVLPSPRDTLKFLLNGLQLWLATGIFLLVPAVVIMIFGLGGIFDLWNDIVSLLSLLAAYFLAQSLTTGEFLSNLWSLVLNEMIAHVLVFLIENIWLLIYIPIYRIGMIRFALTGKHIQSHLAVVKNLKFLKRNFVDILLMYSFNVFNVALLLVVTTILSLTVVGVPLIPIVAFFMTYWNSGYEYGLLARIMVEQEGMVPAPRPGAPAMPAPALAAPAPALAAPAPALAAPAPALAAPAPALAIPAPALAAPALTEAAAPLATAAAPTIAPSGSRYCTSCGTLQEAIYRFCTQCGTPSEGQAA